jgi:hypothetical protein
MMSGARGHTDQVSINKDLATHVVAHACNLSYLGDGGRRIISSRRAQAKLAGPYQKQNTNKRAWSIAQEVENLPSIVRSWVQYPLLGKEKKKPSSPGMCTKK